MWACGIMVMLRKLHAHLLVWHRLATLLSAVWRPVG